MPAARRCPYCHEKLVKPDGSPATIRRKTCGSASCKAKRWRALQRAKRHKNPTPRYDDAVKQLAPSKEVKDISREVIREEVRPLIQDAITEDITNSLKDMVSLIPKTIEVLQEDLESRDDRTRQTAARLVLQYTAGNASIAPRREEDKQQPMQVVFNVPGAPEADLELPAEEIKKCQECFAEKLESEFVSGSNRCQACHDAFQAKLKERFGDG